VVGVAGVALPGTAGIPNEDRLKQVVC